MESHISPKDIEQHAEALNVVPAEEKSPELVQVDAPKSAPVEKTEEKPIEKPAEKSVEARVEKSEEKPIEKVEKKKPNDPDELRKWSTKISQENAALRDEMRAIKAAIEKSAKKPVDYAALAKDPEALRKQMDIERQEAVAELHQQLVAERAERSKHETVVEKMKREQDTDNYPRWNKLFPLIQNLAGNQDGRINFNKAPGDVLDDLYTLADQLSPTEVAAVKAETPVVEVKPVAPVVKTFTEEEVMARVEEARKKAAEEAQSGLRAEANGAGLGSAGKGARRTGNTWSKEALLKLSREEHRALISRE